MKEKSRWIDVSVAIHGGMVHYPGNPPIDISHIQDIEHGDFATVSRLSLGAHTGTHVDAPSHYLKDAPGVDSVSLDSLMGSARVVEIPDTLEIGEKALKGKNIRKGERILLKTVNSERCWGTDAFVPEYAHLTAEGAVFLAKTGVRTVGIDYLSIAKGNEGPKTHQTLLKADVCIIEGLDLSDTIAGVYELVCLPLKIRNGDGAPARALLRRIS